MLERNTHMAASNKGTMHKRRVALGKRLRHSPLVRTLGVRPNIEDYSEAELELLRKAETIYYPSSLYEDVFLTLGKKVFPGNYYRYMGDKVKQTELFFLLGIPHPRTRIYQGTQRSESILQDFSYPFIAKIPRGSSQGRGVFLIRNLADLQGYLKTSDLAYIQEYLPIDRDLRIVLLGGKVAHAYWRIARPGEYRSNVSLGGRISFHHINNGPLRFAEEVARRCKFDEVGLDICICQGNYVVLEANMVYGLKGFEKAGLNIYRLLTERVTAGTV
jgi:ribosomal protein S6--L-glutamate ligase